MIELLPSTILVFRYDKWAMAEPYRFKPVVSFQSIRDNCCSRFNIALHKGFNAIRIRRKGTPKPHTTQSGDISCGSNKHQGLSKRTPPSCPLFLPSYVSLVHLNSPCQPLTTTADHHASQFLQPPPCHLCHDQPHNMKPEMQRLSCIFRYRPSRGRRLALATSALPQTTTYTPCLFPVTAGASETIWPTYPFNILRTVFVGLKPVQEFFEILGIWGLARSFHGVNTLLVGVT